jgi:hypothetical protein
MFLRYVGGLPYHQIEIFMRDDRKVDGIYPHEIDEAMSALPLHERLELMCMISNYMTNKWIERNNFVHTMMMCAYRVHIKKEMGFRLDAV